MPLVVAYHGDGIVVEARVRARVKVDAAGRLVLPQELRRAFGVDGGGHVLLVDEQGRLEVRRDPASVTVDDRDGWPVVDLGPGVALDWHDTAAALAEDRTDR